MHARLIFSLDADSDGSDDFNEGFILPTLVRQIQAILQQYPNDGQILKVFKRFEKCVTFERARTFASACQGIVLGAVCSVRFSGSPVVTGYLKIAWAT